MSDKEKTLLNETTVRRFMNLAGTKKYTDNFLTEEWKKDNNGHGSGKQATDGNGHPTGRWLKEEENLEEEDTLKEQFGAEDEVEDMEGAPLGAEMAFGAEEEMELGPEGEDPLEGEMEASPEAEQIATDVAHALASALAPYGVDVDVSGEGEEGEEELELGPEAEALEGEMPPGPEMGMPPLPGEEEAAALQEAFVRELTSRVTHRVQKERIVETVMRRVAQRLQRGTKR